MSRVILIPVFTFLLMMLSCLPALAKPDLKHCDSRGTECVKLLKEQVFPGLIETLVIRPGVTDEGDVKAMRPAIKAAARALHRYLDRRNQGADLCEFGQQVASNMAALPGEGDAEEKSQVLSRFYDHLFEAAGETGVDTETLRMGLLKSAAVFEKKLSRPRIEAALSVEERELVDLLLLSVYEQVSLRAFLDQYRWAMEQLGAPVMPEWDLRWGQLEQWVREHSQRSLLTVEQALSDPTVLTNAEELIHTQFNEEASWDLLLMKIGLELFFSGYNYPIEPLLERMDSLGGIMSGMTLDRFASSGGYSVYETPTGPKLGAPLGELVILGSITPDKNLFYRPYYRLVDELIDLGGTVPEKPGFDDFADPYLAVFELFYDLDLCAMIAGQEERQAFDEYLEALMADGRPLQPYGMQMRFDLLNADLKRRAKTLKRLKWLPPDTRKAIRVLLSYPTK